MSDWKAHALASLEEARRDIEAETEPTIIVICAIGVVDLANERPLSVYANQSWRWLRQMFAYATWRFSMKAEDELEALRKECATPAGLDAISGKGG